MKSVELTSDNRNNMNELTVGVSLQRELTKEEINILREKLDSLFRGFFDQQWVFSIEQKNLDIKWLGPLYIK